MLSRPGGSTVERSVSGWICTARAPQRALGPAMCHKSAAQGCSGAAGQDPPGVLAASEPRSSGGLLAADAVPVAVEVGAVAGLAEVDGRGPGGTGSGAVLVVHAGRRRRRRGRRRDRRCGGRGRGRLGHERLDLALLASLLVGDPLGLGLAGSLGLRLAGSLGLRLALSLLGRLTLGLLRSLPLLLRSLALGLLLGLLLLLLG